MPHRLRRRFTLIELLVVIAIIAVLAALLLPALSKARQKAMIVLCGAQLKQIAVATSMYAGDEQGWYPYRSYYKADPHQFTRFNHSCCNYGHGIEDPDTAKGAGPMDFELQERYVEPSQVIVCPLKGGNWESTWPFVESGGRRTYSWQGYYLFAGHAAHDITRHPVAADGSYLSPPRTPEATNRTAWRRAVPHHESDSPDLPLAGDQLIAWRENHATTPAGNQGRFQGAHYQGLSPLTYFIGKPDTFASYPVVPINTVYQDGSLATGNDMRMVIAYLSYSRSYYIAEH